MDTTPDMQNTIMESIWWAFAELWKKGGCLPRCARDAVFIWVHDALVQL